MTQISQIINNTVNRHRQFNVLANTDYNDSIFQYINSNQFLLTKYGYLDFFSNYDLYIVDSIKLDSIRQVFTNFLSKIIVIDTDTITDKNTDYCNKKVAYYNRYRQMYPMSVVALDMEQYLYHKDIYDDYIDIKNINFLLLKYLT